MTRRKREKRQKAKKGGVRERVEMRGNNGKGQEEVEEETRRKWSRGGEKYRVEEEGESVRCQSHCSFLFLHCQLASVEMLKLAFSLGQKTHTDKHMCLQTHTNTHTGS